MDITALLEGGDVAEGAEFRGDWAGGDVTIGSDIEGFPAR